MTGLVFYILTLFASLVKKELILGIFYLVVLAFFFDHRLVMLVEE